MRQFVKQIYAYIYLFFSYFFWREVVGKSFFKFADKANIPLDLVYIYPYIKNNTLIFGVNIRHGYVAGNSSFGFSVHNDDAYDFMNMLALGFGELSSMYHAGCNRPVCFIFPHKYMAQILAFGSNQIKDSIANCIARGGQVMSVAISHPDMKSAYNAAINQKVVEVVRNARKSP